VISLEHDLQFTVTNHTESSEQQVLQVSQTNIWQQGRRNPSTPPGTRTLSSHIQSDTGTSQPVSMERFDVPEVGHEQVDSQPSLKNMEALLKHYEEAVCPVMMPTIDPSRNPWLQVYLPLALHTPRSAARSALLHALLSVAAYHKAKVVRHESTRFSGEAAQFEAHALRLLRKITSSDIFRDDDNDRHAMLAASMSLITADVFSGNKGSCSDHLDLARTVLNYTGGETWWKSSFRSSILYQIFRCYDMVASTACLRAADPISIDSPQSCSSESSAAGGEDDPNSAMDDNVPGFDYMRHYTLDTSFGISLHTMALLDKTIRLSRKLNASPTSSLPSEQDRRLADEVERGLYEALANPEALSTLGSHHPVLGVTAVPQDYSTSLSSVITDELTENHIWAFHYGVILFFHRAVQPSTSTLGFSGDMQSLVSKLFDHLENIDCLTCGTDIRPANTLWPGFVAACEAIDTDLRHRALIWFARASEHGIGNISRAKDLVMDVWRRVDRQTFAKSNSPTGVPDIAGLGPIDWRIVMEESGFGIMLT
ncbi:hypothetical protein D6D26_10178, partial [Aureobasidium pullulans]